MTRRSVTVTSGATSIETYVDGSGTDTGVDVVVLPSYGRDGGEDFDAFSAALAEAGYRVLRPQPRGTAGSTGPMSGVTVDDLADDVARQIRLDRMRWSWPLAMRSARTISLLRRQRYFRMRIGQWINLCARDFSELRCG